MFYPNKPGARFDHNYFAKEHKALVESKLKPMGLIQVAIEKGLAVGTADTPPPYVGIGNLTFNSMEEFHKAFGAHGAEVMADAPNYTDIEPVVLINEVSN